MGFLIDGSVLAEHQRRRIDVRPLVTGRREQEFFLSVITASEMLYAAHRVSDPARRTQRTAYVEAVLGGFPILDLDAATARAHARLRTELGAAVARVGPQDLWLAATAVANGLVLATAHVRGLAAVPGLLLERWGGAPG